MTAAALLASPHVVSASTPVATRELEASAQGLGYAWGSDGRPSAETFLLGVDTVASLSAAGGAAPTLVRGFPIAPGERRDVLFERREIYAPQARILVVDDDGEREQPRSSRLHLVGTALDDPRVRVGLSMDAGGGRISGLVSTVDGVFGLRQLDSDDPYRGRYEIGRSLEERLGLEIETGCETPDQPGLEWPAGGPLPAPPAPSGPAPTHEATIAFDTDGEFVGDYADTMAAGDAIADLVAALNVIYERDLGLRLLQGETILRTNAGGDPYASSSTRDQLDEVGDWWEANRSGVARVWVALLSGKGSSGGGGCSGAGIAWVDKYCDPVVSGGPWDGGSYSATQVLRCVALAGSSNTRLIGHEVGHNAGSSHTHCYSPPVDQCYNAQSGCYSGAPVCPEHTAAIPGIAAGKGTIMSYCHFSAPSGAACGSSESYFHPTVISRLQQSIQAATPSCVQVAGGDLAVAKSDAEDPIGRGMGLTYRVTVTNLGPGASTGVQVTDTLPAGVTPSSTSGCAEDPSGVPTCTLGDIPAGEARAFDVTVFVQSSAPALLTNSVSLASTSNDPVTGNDSTNEATAVVDWPCQTSNLDLTAADNAAPGPFVSAGSISAGAGFEVGVGEEIDFRAATSIELADGFSARGDFRAALDPLIDCS